MSPEQFATVVRYYISGIPEHYTTFNCVSPLRDETHASFNVNIPKCVWYDFGAGVGGSGLELVSVLEGVDIAEAKRILDRILSGEAEYPGRYRFSRGTYTRKPLSGTDYVLPSLSISELTSEDYSSFKGNLAERGIAYHVCKRYKWFMRNGSLIIPYSISTVNGHSYAMDYKAISYENGSKVIQTKGGSTLYPMDMLAYNELVICEGEYDVMALISHDIPAITGTAGCSTWRPEWSWALSGKEVTILYDNDEPGRVGSERVLKKVLPYVKSAVLASFPIDKCKGYDVCDYFKEGGSRVGLYEILNRGAYHEGGQAKLFDICSRG